MSNPALFFDDWENKPLVIPVSNCANMQLVISTRNYNVTTVWGDSTKSDFVTTKNVDATISTISSLPKEYSPNFTGDIKVYLKGGLKDVYSYNFAGGVIGTDFNQQYNIQNLGLFLAQMPNLYSYRFDIYAYGVDNRQPTVIGDFAQSPDSVERIRIRAIDVKNIATALVLNFNNFKNTSKLKWFRKENGAGVSTQNALRFIGDIAKIPPLCTHFYIQEGDSILTATSAITYTSGKVWASSFDTLQIPIQLTTAELDNLLIDMDNSINTKIGSGVISLGGFKSIVSDSAVASLQSKGFTVNFKSKTLTNDSSVIFRMDFQNNYNVWSNSLIDITSGNGVGSEGNLPTFALSGRKPGEYCAVFNGSQSIKTTTNLPINSDKVTIAFWMKTTQTSAGIITEISSNTNANNAFSAYINDNVANSIQFNSRNTGVNQSARTGANNGTWKHFVAVIDRAQNGANEILIYENGSLVSFTKPTSTDNNGNFENNILFIGQRAGSTVGFNGSLTRLKIYNYPLAPSEVLNLYNSEL